MTQATTPPPGRFDPSRPARSIFRWRDLRRNRKRASKIKSLHEFAHELACREVRTRRLVHCHGVFDLLHIGHIRHLAEARRLGDHLVVTLTPDHFVNKGPHRPAFDAQTRAEALAALECVDTVCVNEWPTAVETIKLLRPAVFMKGMVAGSGPRDRNGAIDSEQEAVAAVGGRMVLSDTELHSASALINRHTDTFDERTRDFLATVRAETGGDALVSALRRLRELRVCIVGADGVARVLEGLCDQLTVASSADIEECDLAIVASREARLLAPADRRRIRACARVLAVDLVGNDAVAADGWHDVGPDLMICDESLGSAVASVFDETIALRTSGAAAVRDRTRGVRVEIPAFPVNPVNQVDASGGREAFVAYASAALALGLGPRAMGFLGNVARSAAMTVPADEAPETTSVFRQIDSLLK
ncbi:MAG: adenylyltransferase/cytidyltransferase family protein [Myxococcota bacterium]|jgi:cytidyltransferase-like protein|nr:adenylyltransferase/cytidyltransferase family protein [Myxococcota bacterium]